MKAEIFDIFRGTTHDGPGLRSTVFFRGCSLRCNWCHNPESISHRPHIWWDEQRCIGCGSCMTSCPAEAINATPLSIQIFDENCIQCGRCAEQCPTKALEPISKQYCINELSTILLKDKDYYSQFNGGVTASGGEPLLQAPFVAELFRRLKDEGIHTALDTCGSVSFSAFQKVLPYTDCILYDLKLADSFAHHLHTGNDNTIVLKNFHYLMAEIKRGGKECTVWIRTPLIPDATASEQNILQIAEIISPYCGNTITRWELCAFNNICEKKYRKLGLEWTFAGVPLLEEEKAKQILSVALESVGNRISIALTGILR